MRLTYLIKEMGANHWWLNPEAAARFAAIQQRKELLSAELYQLMKADQDI